MKKGMINTDFKRHFSLLACSDIQQICQPLFTYLQNIKAFQFSRVYPDGSRLELSNHAENLENTFITRATLKRLYTPALIPENQRYILINHWVDNMQGPAQKILEIQLYNQRELFNLGNELTIVKRYTKYVEYFTFFAHSDDHSMNNFYFNNIEIFEHFAIYFVNTAHTLIKKADNDRVLKPWRKKESELVMTSNISNFNHKSLIQSITPKKLIIKINEREIHITKREIECALLLLQGKKNQNIANTLFISQRTVESHLDSLRLKTNCANREQLMAFLFKSDLARFILPAVEITSFL